MALTLFSWLSKGENKNTQNFFFLLLCDYNYFKMKMGKEKKVSLGCHRRRLRSHKKSELGDKQLPKARPPTPFQQQ